jgi:hypothetical protein
MDAKSVVNQRATANAQTVNAKKMVAANVPKNVNAQTKNVSANKNIFSKKGLVNY